MPPPTDIFGGDIALYNVRRDRQFDIELIEPGSGHHPDEAIRVVVRKAPREGSAQPTVADFKLTHHEARILAQACTVAASEHLCPDYDWDAETIATTYTDPVSGTVFNFQVPPTRKETE